MQVNTFLVHGDIDHHRHDKLIGDVAGRASLLPEAGPLGIFGAVVGHDGSGAALPDIGPYDFSNATRVTDAMPLGSTGAAIRMSLTPHADMPQYVVKACPSAGHAAQAWLASRLFGAVGLATPTAVLVRGCSQAFDGTHDPARVYLATTFLSRYQDLGDWLESDDAWRVFEGASGADGPGARDISRLQSARDEATAAGRQMAGMVASNGAPFHALSGEAAKGYADALARRNVMRHRLCHALPDVYQCALERHYVAALWLGNRDMCNVFMENIGVWRDKNDLPYAMSLDFDSADFAATLEANALADVSQPYGDRYAPFARRLKGLTGGASNKTVHDELKNPVGVRALAAEMAYRLGRISAQDIRPWAQSAHAVARAGDAACGTSPGAAAACCEPDALVPRLLAQRDHLVERLGGTWAAQTWAHMYGTRAKAIDARQAPFRCAGQR
ncbi:hypothetical protein [Pandoraea commovens]|uniref:Uncharacterized protein n=1 Tax=Pandoraea commovens TaxID=2508289 RepID=A0A5E4Y9X4_9BURK|nr:hypothetical protein [Pandoraea commovens]UVA78128.1 hypothetical protein NTU39_18875 [Pandoraea commovens]VVE45262.1 hypothetical protein PCO31010_04383 [Pandoraea commovens]